MRKTFAASMLVALVFTGAGCNLSTGSSVKLTPVTLEYWRTDDDPATLADQITAYQKLHPNVTINYHKMRSEDYEKSLLEAFAENRGPDIFSIPNVTLGGWLSKIQPMPKETTIATQTVNAQKQVVVVKKKAEAMTILQLRNDFIEGVSKDLIRPFVEKPFTPPVDRIFGVALSADTLGLFYNKDLLKKADIPKPPETWKDLQDEAGKMTIIVTDPDNKKPPVIKLAGAAIGLSKNVLYNVDILSAIMSQNGAEMTDSYAGYATFANFTAASEGKIYPPGVEALIFYQSFSIPGTQFFTWDADQPSSLDAFITGKAAFFFGFPSDAQQIHERAPQLDYGVAPLPQVDPSNPVNVLHYPVEVVSKKTAHADEAWDFLQFIAAQDQVKAYLQATKRPTSQRALIQDQLADPDVAPFAGQLLTAKNWYRGTDYSKVEAAFAYMIDTRPTTEQPEYLPIVAQGVGMVNETIH